MIKYTEGFPAPALFPSALPKITLAIKAEQIK